MRILKLAAAALSAVLLTAPLATAQNYQQANPNGAAGILNSLVQPQPQPPQSGRPTDYRSNGGGQFARYSDEQLRTESRRAQDQMRQAQDQTRAVDDEMRRRNIH